MFSSRALGRFFGPYLAFAALSGLGAGFVLGTLVSLGGLVAGIVTLVSGGEGGTVREAATEVVQGFAFFALVVLVAVGWGFASGFFAGLTAALVGGLAGFWWSFVVVFGGICFVYPFYMPYRHFDPSLPVAIIVSTGGVLFPLLYLGTDARKLPYSAPIHHFLSQSWLVNPPQGARIAGMVLPFLLYGAWEIKMVWPEFVTHQNYVTRLGNWTTWQSSKRLVAQNGYRSSSCQSNLKQIALATRQYMSDYNEFLPPTPVSPSKGAGALLQPYLKSTQIFQCPQELYSAQNADFASGDFSDYWFNARLYAQPEAAFNFIDKTVTWGDGNTGAGEANAAYSLRNLPSNWAPTLRHRSGGANYAFADGHVKWLKGGAVSNTAAPRGGSFTLSP